MRIYSSSESAEAIARLKRKSEDDPDVVGAVRAIVDDIRQNGDKALSEYTARFASRRPRLKPLMRRCRMHC